MSAVAILPLLVILLLAASVGGLIGKAGRVRFISFKFTHWLLLIYLIILLLAAAFVPFLPETKMERGNHTEQEMDLGMNEAYDDLSKGNIEKVDPAYLVNDEKIKNYQFDTLAIKQSLNPSEFSPAIFVERVKAPNNTVEIFAYKNHLFVNGQDFTGKVKPFKLGLAGNTLTINPQYQKIRFSVISNSFPVRQLKGETMENGSFFSSGEAIIYLRIPSGVEVKAEEGIILIDVK